MKAEKENVKDKIWKATLNYFIIYQKNGFYDKALLEADKIITYAKNENLYSELNESYIFKGNTYIRKEGFSLNALNCYNKAYKIASTYNLTLNKLDAIAYISAFYDRSGNVNEAIKNYKKIIHHLKTLKKDSIYIKKYKNRGLIVSHFYNYIAKAYITIKKADSAFFFNELMLKELIDDNSRKYKYWKGEYYISRAECHFINKEYDSAETNYIKAYELLNSKNQISNRDFQKAIKFGKLAFKQKKYRKAIDIFENEMKRKGLFNKDTLIYLNDFYKFLAYSHKEIGNVTRANKYFDNYLKTTSKIETNSNKLSNELFENERQKFKTEINKIEKKKEKQKKNIFIVFIIFIFIISLIYFFLAKKKSEENKLKYNTLLNKITELEKDNSKKRSTPNKGQSLKQEEVERILKALLNFIDKEQYLNGDCTLSTTAKILKTNTTYLSKTINSEYEKSFNAFINELRINYALKRLKSDRLFRKYSIQSIANELGYKSKESFNKAFRNQTGILPSYFIKELEKDT